MHQVNLYDVHGVVTVISGRCRSGSVISVQDHESVGVSPDRPTPRQKRIE